MRFKPESIHSIPIERQILEQAKSGKLNANTAVSLAQRVGNIDVRKSMTKKAKKNVR